MRCEQRLWVSVPAGSLSSEIIWHKKGSQTHWDKYCRQSNKDKFFFSSSPSLNPPPIPVVSALTSVMLLPVHQMLLLQLLLSLLCSGHSHGGVHKMRRKEKITGRLTPVKRVNRNSLLPPCLLCPLLILQSNPPSMLRSTFKRSTSCFGIQVTGKSVILPSSKQLSINPESHMGFGKVDRGRNNLFATYY